MIQLESQSKEELKLAGSFFWSNKGDRNSRRKEIINNSIIASSMNSMLFNINGKPYLLDGKVFSISHSLEYSVLVESNIYSSIGIDIEVDRPFNYWERIAKRFFLESEKKYCEGSKGINRFWQIWVKKEAIIKCFGGSILENALDVDTFNYNRLLGNDKIYILYSVLTNYAQNIHVSIAYCQ